MNPAAVGSYLAARLGGDVEVQRVHRTFPGMSRETWLVDAAGPDGRFGLVLRVDSVGSETPFPLEREWELYRRLWKTSIPVPEPLWYDAEATIADGRPLLARRLVEGSPRPPGIEQRGPEGAAARREAALRHVGRLAELHLLDWHDHGFDDVLPAPTVDDPYAVEFATWRVVWDEGKTDPFPIITEVIDWLSDLRPRAVPHISLLKGNNGLGEEIWRDGEIVALVDWELAALGDPALDIAFSQGLLADGAAEILARYANLTGDVFGDERLAFASLWVTFKSLCCLNARALRSHLEGRGRRTHRVNLGMGVAKNFERILGSVVGLGLVDAHRRVAPELPGNGYLAGVKKR